MADKASGEKAGEKSFFARTAKNTTKKAKRAQEKVKRKLGKSEETKDEMFDRYVENFNKQQEAVQRLQKELKNYINCLKEMLNANQLFGEAVKQVYEPAWSGREKFVRLLDSLGHSWKNLVEQLQDEVLEPLTSYQIQFPDTKNRIAKRSRKVVDYDRNRHHLETLKVKGGKAADPRKLSQAEEDYNQAKNAYLQLHSDLYEELPALYDSRISIYVSSFQSIFTAEGVFHRETAKIKTEMNDLLDVLAKETSAGAYSTRRPLSVISNVSSDGDSSPENCAKCDQTDGKAGNEDHTEENSENETSENDEANDETDKPSSDTMMGEPPSDNKPENSRSDNTQEMPASDNTQDKPPSDNTQDKSPSDNTQDKSPSDNTQDKSPPDKPEDKPPSEKSQDKPHSDNIDENPPSDIAQTEAEMKSNHPPVRPPQPSKGTPSPNADEVVKDTAVEHEKNPESTDALDGALVEGKNETIGEKNDVEKEEETQSNIDSSRVLYKVEATHPYTGEDDDELTFEKGDIIKVIPYTESDDPDDGWLLGIMESTGIRGVFPENFTKKFEE